MLQCNKKSHRIVAGEGLNHSHSVEAGLVAKLIFRRFVQGAGEATVGVVCVVLRSGEDCSDVTTGQPWRENSRAVSQT